MSRRIGVMLGVLILVLIALLITLLGGFARETPVETPSKTESELVSEYPALEPLVDFVGENELSVLHLVGFRAAQRAMKELSFKRGDKNILAFTDAGYIAKIGDYTTEKALDGVITTSALSRGKGNLINVHKPYNSPLWFAFFNKDSKECVYLEVKGDILKDYLDREMTDKAVIKEFLERKDEDIFVRVAKENIDADRLLEKPESWQEKMVGKVFGGNEFSLITLSNLWAIGLPNDFMKAAELHDHICPGLTSGYLIAKYVIKYFPTSDPKTEYTIIAIPSWCKDDVLIQMFETNVGHKRMYVKYLTKEQMEALPKEAKNVANIVIRWPKGAETGEGLVIGFNWDKAFEQCGIERAWLRDFSTYRWWWVRLKMDLWMMDYLNNPDALVFTIGEKFTVDQAKLEKLKAAGVNPLVELGLMD